MTERSDPARAVAGPWTADEILRYEEVGRRIARRLGLVFRLDPEKLATIGFALDGDGRPVAVPADASAPSGR